MASPEELAESRVAVYIDFDNVVISRYDQVHGREAWRRDEARTASDKVRGKLDQARVDVGAILEYASSYGTIALSRAYADWSVPANAAYRTQLVDRAIDLTQLFSTSGTKNGADIRLAVDVVDDLFRLSDITHVVIVAGDSDYIPLVQRCKRLGRVVVGIGIEGSTSSALVHALDEFASYDTLLTEDDDEEAAAAARPADDQPEPEEPARVKMSPTAASRLLVRALELGQVNQADDEWINASRVKSQMKRLNASFNEKDLGFPNFMEFVRSRSGQVEIREEGQQRHLRLRPAKPPKQPKAAKAPKPDAV
jgi:Uncharacterized conserved protein